VPVGAYERLTQAAVVYVDGAYHYWSRNGSKNENQATGLMSIRMTTQDAG
jgi:hypothetical protein